MGKNPKAHYGLVNRVREGRAKKCAREHKVNVVFAYRQPTQMIFGHSPNNRQRENDDKFTELEPTIV